MPGYSNPDINHLAKQLGIYYDSTVLGRHLMLGLKHLSCTPPRASGFHLRLAAKCILRSFFRFDQIVIGLSHV